MTESPYMLYRSVEPYMLRLSYSEKPSFLSTFTDEDADLDLENQTITRKMDRNHLCGMSMFGQSCEYHKNIINDLSEVSRTGDYSLNLDAIPPKKIIGMVNPFRKEILLSTANGKSKKVKLFAYICYGVDKREIPGYFEVINDNATCMTGHHTVAVTTEQQSIFGIVNDGAAPLPYLHAVSSALVDLNWQAHYIKLRAAAEPLPYEEDFDHDVWSFAMLLNQQDFDEANFPTISKLLNEWERNSYQCIRILSRPEILGLIDTFTGVSIADEEIVDKFLTKQDNMLLGMIM
jgi:hypothetical protein